MAIYLGPPWSMAAIGFPTLDELLSGPGLREPSESDWVFLQERLDLKGADRLCLSENGPWSQQFHEIQCLRGFFSHLDQHPEDDRDWEREVAVRLPPVESFTSCRWVS